MIFIILEKHYTYLLEYTSFKHALYSKHTSVSSILSDSCSELDCSKLDCHFLEVSLSIHAFTSSILLLTGPPAFSLFASSLKFLFSFSKAATRAKIDDNIFLSASLICISLLFLKL